MAIFQKQPILLVWKEVRYIENLKGLGIKEFN